MITKICTKCAVEKGVGEYSKMKAGKYGVRAECRCCVAVYQQANKEATAERMKAYHHANREAALERMKAYYHANKEAVAEQRKSYRLANKETLAERDKAYYEANRPLYYAKNAQRKASKKKATPAWADLEAIKGIYLLAAINREGGFDLHVDHIVPLQSDIVCGLHCEANLQLMRASDNISKGNRRWPDMP